MDGDALRPRVTVTDRDLEAYYQQHRDEFKEDEQACASHILIKVSTDPKAKEGHGDAEARKIAEGLLEQVKAGGDFAALAKKSSEDQGSAPNGGDLGCFPRGRMVPQFDEAVFSMEPGTTSDLVKSPFGYHIIRLVSRREEQVPTLSAVKERIRPLVHERRRWKPSPGRRPKASRPRLAKGRSLEDAAKEHGFTVQKSAPLARGEVKDPLSSPSLVARLFELKPGAIEKEGFAVPAGRSSWPWPRSSPRALPDLTDVQEKVKADLVEEKAFAEAAALAADLRARAEKTDLEKAAAALSPRAQGKPGLVGRGQPLGDLGPAQPSKTPRSRSRRRRSPSRSGWPRATPSCACSRRRPSTPRPSPANGSARRLPEAAEARAALPGLSEPGPRSLHDRAEGRRLQAGRWGRSDELPRRGPAGRRRRDRRPQGQAHRGSRRPDPSRDPGRAPGRGNGRRSC